MALPCRRKESLLVAAPLAAPRSRQLCETLAPLICSTVQSGVSKWVALAEAHSIIESCAHRPRIASLQGHVQGTAAHLLIFAKEIRLRREAS